jgi:OOP family OmpA-OmpF porin
MRTSLFIGLIGAAFITNVQAAGGNFYDPSLDNLGLDTSNPQALHAPDALEVQSINDHELIRTIGCPGRQLLDKTCPIEDADKDTVEDWADKCPGTPAGMKVNALGCEIDTDGDGVLDSVDKCPTVYARTPDGCPVVEAAPAPAPVPVPPAPAPEPAPMVILGDVNFAFDSAVLKPNAKEKIEKAVAHIQKMSDENFELLGHTDSIGTEEYNMGLSQRRADAVRNAMIKLGVAPERLIARGYGETKPIASNATKEGRAENRRVELLGRKASQ